MGICIFIFVVDLCGHCFDMSEQAARVELVPVKMITLIVPAKNFQASVKCRKAQKCLYLTLSIQCHMQLKLLMSLTAV